MNKEISRRTSDETFDGLEEITYKVDSTGATISTACSISLLHRYCNKLSHDKYFTPMPKFFYEDDINGTICKISLPPNAPIHLVDSVSCQSKDDATRVACLKACEELHKLGALSDYLLPGLSGASSTSSALNSQSGNDEDEISKEELHETRVPDIFKGPWISNGGHVTLHFYYIKFNPVPNDRDYRMFGLFTRAPLPKEAESLQVELHLARSRIVETELVPSGMMKVSDEEIVLAQNFQKMCLKVILDGLDFSPDFVSLERCHGHDNLSSKHYLLLPVSEQKYKGSMMIDWTTIRHCLSSPVFSGVINKIEKGVILHDTMELLSGRVKIDDVLNSLVFTPHNKLFFFVDAILPQVNASSGYKDSKVTTYAEYYMERFGIQLSHPEQPFLKAKSLFNLRNLLYNRVHNTTEARELLEHFVELPPELCQLKIVGFTKDIGSSLSLLPSFMHRLENILVAIELKDVLCLTFPEASEIRAQYVLEALTTEKCLERISLERFEVLGDAFLKYAVGRHSFISYEGLDEGQLTRKRSNIVNNSNRYDLAIKRNLQVYIRDEIFDPAQFFALGRPCQVVCTDDMHHQPTDATRDRANVKCYKLHRWLYRKTIADVVESLVGAFLVGSGFKAAIAFLRWIGILVDFDVSSVHRVCQLSMDNMSLLDMVNINEVETLLGHKFNYKGLLLQALVHPSFTKHTGGCYLKLEFLGDAVMEYLITSYLYSVYPDLKPGQITDLRSLSVNNISFAHVALSQSLHKYLIKDSNILTEEIKKFKIFVNSSNSESDMLEEAPCPKVLGDIVESSVGAILLDTGFDLRRVWSLMLKLLQPVLSFSSVQLNPVRELRELCQYFKLGLNLPDPVKEANSYLVKVEVNVKGEVLSFNSVNKNFKAGGKIAAREALTYLKRRGYKHIAKSLGEVIRKTRRQEAELIGFNEEPLVVYNVDDHFEKLNLQKVPSTLDSQNANNGRVSSEGTCYSSRTGGGKESLANESYERSISEPVIHNHEQKNVNVASCPQDIILHKMEKSLLMEMCEANCWDRPSFECYKVEGPPHLRMFTYKVTVKVEGAQSTILECFGEARPKKRAAEDHAAEGALWYLKHLGYRN